MVKVYIYPQFGGPDQGDGGVRRVVEAQHKHLPAHGITVVNDPAKADVLAAHIAADERILRDHPDKPLVAHSHGLYWAEYQWEKWAYKANAICMETIRQADAITAPTPWVANAIRRGTQRRVGVLPHGVDIEDWPQGTPQGEYVLWNKTRTDPVCDPEALDHLARLVPDVQFVTTYGQATPNVHTTGRLPYDEAKAQVLGASVYLCTARETFGIGTIEAMAAGVPVLGWRWGGQVNIVEHMVTGYLARPGDFDDLAEGLRLCLGNRELWGAAARQAVIENYQWPLVMEAYADIYKRVHAQHQAQAKAPRVSVVVPAHGLADYLPQTLDSVLAQTDQDWECIVVDDASPDETGQIADDYAARDPRFKVIHNETNQYLAGALNTGIKAASGRFILPLDADNLITPQTLELLAGALQQNRSLHIAYGRVQFVTEDGRHDQSVGPDGHSGWPPTFRGEWQLLRRRGDGGPSNLVPSTSMFRKTMWRDLGGYRRRYRTGEDADFWTRATSYGYRAAMVTQADTLIYRNRDDSMSRVEEQKDWTAWLPWCGGVAPLPSGAITDEQPPVQSYDPPAVSVVIPVGPGHQELLTDALDSLLAQTFPRWECIVVNDTGKPLAVPSWVRLIDLGGPPGDLGVAKARNLAISQAQAPLFVPLDADDNLEVFYLEKLLPVQRQFGGVVYSDWHQLYSNGESSVWQTEEYSQWLASTQLKIWKGCLHAVTAIYPVEAWFKVGGFDETLPAWEDWDFQLKLADIAVCGTRYPEPLFTYRKDTGQRRDDNYANFQSSKEAIREKWGPYFDGGETLMACRGCQGGGGQVSTLPTPQIQQNSLPPSGADYVIVEYIGNLAGGMIYRPSSGNQYRFAGLEGERVKYVALGDTDYFASRPDFRVTTPDPPPAIPAVEAVVPGLGTPTAEAPAQDAWQPPEPRVVQAQETAPVAAAVAGGGGRGTHDDVGGDPPAVTPKARAPRRSSKRS